MKLEELKVEQLKKELTKLELPSAGNKAELQKSLIDAFKWRDIDIGTFVFWYIEEVEVFIRKTTSTMFSAMMNKFKEIQEISRANNVKLEE